MKALYLVIVCSISCLSFAAEVKKQKEVKEIEQIEKQIPPFADHTLLIFIDDTENTTQAITGALATALFQKAGPILASRHVLHNLWELSNLNTVSAVDKESALQMRKLFDFERKKLIELIPAGKALDEKEQTHIVEQLNKELSAQPEFKALQYIPFYLIQHPFQPEEWDIKEVNDDLILLIPKGYKPARFSEIGKHKGPLTDRELRFGLKIDHMKTIESKNFADYIMATKKVKNEGYFIDAIRDKSWYEATQNIVLKLYESESESESDEDEDEEPKKTPTLDLEAQNVIRTLATKLKKLEAQANVSSIFVSRAEYKEYGISVEDMPHWALFIFGHGLLSDKIAGLLWHEFANFLEFIDSKIVTKLLVYSSCYAGGTTEQRFYGILDKSIMSSDTYSYAIVVGAVTEAIVNLYMSSYIPIPVIREEIDFDQKKLRPFSIANFAEFIKEVTTNDVVKFNEIIALLGMSNKKIYEQYHKRFLSTSTAQEAVRRSLNATARIQLPGTEWFSVLENVDIVSIGPKFAASHSPKETIHISTFFRRQGKSAYQTKAILLGAQSIPFELNVDTQEYPLFISMVPGEAMHIIEKLSMVARPLNEVILSFGRGKIDYGYRKIFWIKECVIRNGTYKDIIISMIGKDILSRMYSTEKDITIYYTNENGSRYKGEGEAEFFMPTTDYIKEYIAIAAEDHGLKHELKWQKKIDAIRAVYEKKALEFKKKEAANKKQ